MDIHSATGPTTPAIVRQVISLKPIIVPTTDRGIDLQVKVTAPADGTELPVIVFSHGNAWSMDGYEPLVDRWAAAGFVVVQPTHLDSRRHGIGFDDPRFATIWRIRIADLHAVVDGLHTIIAQVSGLNERVDHERLAVVGHSWGAQTAGTLLGARVLDAEGNPGQDFSHPDVKAGALIAATGVGDALTPFAVQYLPFARPDFSTMTAPTLIIAGGKDQSAISTRGPEWFTDAYHLSPAHKQLLTIAEAAHLFGGISGEATRDTTDEDPAAVALVADAISAYLLDALVVEKRSLAGRADPSQPAPGRFQFREQIDRARTAPRCQGSLPRARGDVRRPPVIPTHSPDPAAPSGHDLLPASERAHRALPAHVPLRRPCVFDCLEHLGAQCAPAVPASRWLEKVDDPVDQLLHLRLPGSAGPAPEVQGNPQWAQGVRALVLFSNGLSCATSRRLTAAASPSTTSVPGSTGRVRRLPLPSGEGQEAGLRTQN